MMEGAMRGLRIGGDLSASELRGYARLEKDPRVARRMLAIANALDGMSRVQSARLAGMDRQALRDWVIRHNEAGLEGLHDRRGDGRLLSDRRVAIKAVILQAAAGKYLGFCVWDS